MPLAVTLEHEAFTGFEVAGPEIASIVAVTKRGKKEVYKKLPGGNRTVLRSGRPQEIAVKFLNTLQGSFIIEGSRLTLTGYSKEMGGKVWDPKTRAEVEMRDPDEPFPLELSAKRSSERREIPYIFRLTVRAVAAAGGYTVHLKP